MDKKKVTELIFKAHHYIEEVFHRQADNNNAIDAMSLANASVILLTAISELSKSDWVSVEDGLPPYEEEVLVRDINAKGNWSKPWICYRSKNECYRHITDKHKFVTTRLGEITHWRPIEKLEE